MIRGLLGADPSTGAIEIGEVVATVQVQVRDAAGADKDLRLAIERAGAELPGRPAGALLFTCNGRGRRMFEVADHDASTIEALLWRDSARRLFRGRGDRPDRGPQRVTRIYRVDGAVHRTH